jgi:putative MATE family efflux protein
LNSLQTVNSLLDGFFIEKLEPAALTAAGAATSMVFLFGSLSFMMGTASTALVSRFFGAGDQESLQTASQKSLSLALYLGFAMAALALPLSPLAAGFFVPAGNEEAKRQMVMYLGIFACSLPALNLIQALAGSLRGIGDTLSPMILSGGQILLHIALNYFLIFPSHDLGFIVLPGAGWGLAGAGASMSLSAWASAMVYLVWARRTALRARLTADLPGLEWTQRILRIAIPSGLLSILRVTSLMAFTVILAQTPNGSAAISAMRLGFGIESMAFMPAFGLAIAAGALVGQSLGMKDPARASRLGWLAGHHAAVVSTLVAICLVIFSGPLAHALAGTQKEVADITARYIVFIGSTETFFAYAMVMSGAMQGAGDTRSPMLVTLVTMWFIRVPLAAACALPWGLNMGADGCWLAMSATQTIAGIMAMALFHKGAWKKVEV